MLDNIFRAANGLPTYRQQRRNQFERVTRALAEYRRRDELNDVGERLLTKAAFALFVDLREGGELTPLSEL